MDPISFKIDTISFSNDAMTIDVLPIRTGHRSYFVNHSIPYKEKLKWLKITKAYSTVDGSPVPQLQFQLGKVIYSNINILNLTEIILKKEINLIDNKFVNDIMDIVRGN